MTPWILVIVSQNAPYLHETEYRFESKVACQEFPPPPPPAALRLEDGSYLYVCISAAMLRRAKEALVPAIVDGSHRGL